MDAPTSLLFFPGTRPELLPKAVGTGAGWVCVDLEDAVLAPRKGDARTAVVDVLSSPGRPSGLVVRINHPDTPAGRADLEALKAAEAGGPFRVMIPKVGGPAAVEAVRVHLASEGEGVGLVPVIETASGLESAKEIAAEPGVVGLLFGALDLSTELGCEPDWEPLLYARSACVLAARLGAIPLLDSPFLDVDDPEGLREEAVRARRLGFDGKAAIHPSQVDVIHDAFRPTEAEIERARRVVSGLEESDDGAFLLDGVMVDRPVVEAARRLLARVGPET